VLQQRVSGRSVLFVHHVGEGGLQRGTSRRENILDTVIALKHPLDYIPDQGASFEVHFEKSRGFYGDDSKPFEAQLRTDVHDRQCWVRRSLDESNYERIVRLLNDGLPQKDISIELGLSKSTVNYHAKRAREEGRLLK
jgi:putative DNA primase/helicase